MRSIGQQIGQIAHSVHVAAGAIQFSGDFEPRGADACTVIDVQFARAQGQAFASFAGIAIFVACLGLLSLSVFTAESRTKEIGIRKAMGASKTEILRLLLWQFTKPVLWANLITWPAAYLIMRRWLEGFAYHVDLRLWMFLAASGLALLIAVVTVLGHALLVARAKPVAALRYE